MRHTSLFHTQFRPVLLLLALATLALLATLPAPPRAHAATFTVTRTADTNDGSCDAGDCSLREAIAAANLNPGPDTATLPAGAYTLTIAGSAEDANATGDLDVTGILTINGLNKATTIIDGGGGGALDDRILHVLAGATVTVNDVTVRGGNLVDVDGGGLLNEGTLTLNRVSVRDNVVSGDADGGGFYTEGTLTITDGMVMGNTSEEDGGGGAVDEDTTTTTITNSTISGNMAGEDGVGLLIEEAMTTITGSTISGNHAVGDTDGGGWISISEATPAPVIMIMTSMILNNTTGDDGGGIHVADEFPGDTVTITGSTISNNRAPAAGADGGGGVNNGTLVLTNSTISGNMTEDDGGGFFNFSGTSTLTHVTIFGNTAGPTTGGGIFAFGGTVTVDNTIVAGNTNGDCASGGGMVISADHNLGGDGSCPFTMASDVINTAPLLGALGPNGGFSQTHALLPGSLAINAGDSALTVDQRGAPRPGTADNDIGAYERNHVDLAISKSDGQTKVLPGQALGYAIVVSNAGPDPVIDAVVTDTFLAPLIAGCWTCVTGGGGGGVCDVPGPMAGNIATTVDLPVGGSVIFSATATATVATPAAGLAPNTATVAVADPAITTDLDPSNNSATDVDSIPAPVAVLPGGGADDDDVVPTPAPACALGGFTQGTTGPEGGTVTGGNGCVTVEGGPDLDIDIATRAARSDQPPTPGSILVGVVIVQITASDVGSGKPVTTFDPPLTICVTIEDGAATGSDPELMYWTGSEWAPGANPTFDAATGEACAEFDHLTDFAVLGTLPIEEEEEEPVVKEEPEEPSPSATLALVAGGQFVQWTFGATSASVVFPDLKIAWLFNTDTGEAGGGASTQAWTSFIPQLGITDFVLGGGAVLWLVAFADIELPITAS